MTPLSALSALFSRIPAESAVPLLGDAGVEFKICHTLVVPEDSALPLILLPVFGGADTTIDGVLTVWHQHR